MVARTLVEHVSQLRDSLAAFEPERLTGAQCAALVGALEELKNACAAASARAALRAADCGAHRDVGFADPADWLARQGGTSVGAARTAIETALALEACPDTAAAVAGGTVSLEQAREITRTEHERPGSEAELLELARNAGMGKLRDHARKLRHRAIGVEEVHRRQVAARSFRHWRNDLGNIEFRGQLPPEVGVPFINRIDAECDRVRRDTKKRADDLESRDAYRADALARMLDGTAKRGGTDVVVVVDLRAWRRGHAHDGEVCHVIGGGDIPVDAANEIADDAFLKAVVHDGVRIGTVKHFGRHIKAELRTALDLGPLPDFDGLVCVEQGCERRGHLQLDHIDPVANWGPTSFENLQPLCWDHHVEKTERDRRAGLLSGRGPSP